MQDTKKNNIAGHVIVSIVAISVFLGSIQYSGLWYPDAPSHALNGVFYKDMIAERGFLSPTSYAERYYVQYPALTVGTYPPLFYTIEGMFFKLLGVSHTVAKLTVLIFTLLGVNMFFLLCRIWFSLGLSIVYCIVFLLQPAVLFAQKNVMLEMPALAISLLALYCLYVGMERNNSLALFLTPLFMALAFLTKQSAVFLLPVWFLWTVLSKRKGSIKSTYFILGILTGTVILLPWAIVNLTISKFYVVGGAFTLRHVAANAFYYLTHVLEIVSCPVILLCFLSVVLFKRLKKRDGYTFSLFWAGGALLCLLLYDKQLVSAEPRQAMFLVPASILLCAHVIWFLKDKLTFLFQHRAVFPILMTVFVGFHSSPRAVFGGRDIRGFDRVADFVVGDLSCISTLYDGYFNGNFIFHMRSQDPNRRVFVFRASKVVFSTKWLLSLGYNKLVDEEANFHELLNRYSVKYLVQEENDSMKTAANRMLRGWVRKPEFRLVKKYPITGRGLEGPRSLLVYEYLKYEAKPIRRIDLDMPALGRKIIVNLEKDSFPR